MSFSGSLYILNFATFGKFPLNYRNYWMKFGFIAQICGQCNTSNVTYFPGPCRLHHRFLLWRLQENMTQKSHLWEILKTAQSSCVIFWTLGITYREGCDDFMLPIVIWVFTDRIRSMGEGNVFTGVCLFTGGPALEGEGFAVGGRGVCIEGVVGICMKGVCMERADPLPADMVNRQSVCILLECILVSKYNHILVVLRCRIRKCGQTNTSEHIAFPQLRLRVISISIRFRSV